MKKQSAVLKTNKLVKKQLRWVEKGKNNLVGYVGNTPLVFCFVYENKDGFLLVKKNYDQFLHEAHRYKRLANAKKGAEKMHRKHTNDLFLKLLLHIENPLRLTYD